MNVKQEVKVTKVFVEQPLAKPVGLLKAVMVTLFLGPLTFTSHSNYKYNYWEFVKLPVKRFNTFKYLMVIHVVSVPLS